MAGLFPNAGVSPDKATNSSTPDVVEGCEILFHKSRCRPRFDPAAANAIISELTNAINVVRDYDCTRLDNFKLVLEYIKNLCNQPTRAFNIDNAFMAGCFSGVSGLVDAQIILDYIRSLIPGGGSGYSICSLEEAISIINTDSVGFCQNGQDRRIPLQYLAEYLNVSPNISAGLFAVGATTASYLGAVTSLPNRQIDVTNYSALIVRDRRSPSGGQNPQNPGEIRINGDDIVFHDSPEVNWEGYNSTYVLFRAVDPLYPENFDWYRLHESGGAWKLPGSPGTAQYLRFDLNYSNVAVFAATPLAGV